MSKEHRDSLRREDAVENFIVDDSSSDDNMETDLTNGGIMLLLMCHGYLFFPFYFASYNVKYSIIGIILFASF